MEGMRSWLLALALAGASLPVCAMRISGLSAIDPVAMTAQVFVQDGGLHIVDAQERRIEITPWPRYLPQSLASRQNVNATRNLHPAGPADRIEFRQPDERTPWMVIGSGMRAGQQVLGYWRLVHEDRLWKLRRGSAWRVLGQEGRPAEIRVDGNDWCVYLLDVQGNMASGDGVVQEWEARVDIVAVRAGNAACEVASR